jgi:hypothetical protein
VLALVALIPAIAVGLSIAADATGTTRSLSNEEGARVQVSQKSPIQTQLPKSQELPPNQQKPQQPSKKPVSRLRGFTLGEKVANADECPKGADASKDVYLNDEDYPSDRKGKMCWKYLEVSRDPSGSKTLTFTNVRAKRGFTNSALVVVMNDVIQGVEVTFNSDIHSAYLAELNAAFGHPTKSRTREYVGVRGDELNNVYVEWKGTVGTATFLQYAGSETEGSALLYSNSYLRLSSEPAAVSKTKTVVKTR